MRLKYLGYACLITLIFCQSKINASENNYLVRPFEDRPAYFGAGLEYMFLKRHGNYQRYLAAQYYGPDVFLGWRFNKYLGLELGYAWTISQAKGINLANGDTVAGNAVANMNTHVDTKLRLKTTHLDASLYAPLSKNIDAVFMAGVGVLRQKFAAKVDPAASNVAAMFNIGQRTNFVPRFGLGIDGNFSENWSLRIMAKQQLMRSVRLRDNGGVLGNDPFRASTIISLSIYRYFEP